MHQLDGFKILVRLDLPVKLPVTCGWIWGPEGRWRCGGGLWLFLHKEQAPKETIFRLSLHKLESDSLGVWTVDTWWPSVQMGRSLLRSVWEPLSRGTLWAGLTEEAPQGSQPQHGFVLQPIPSLPNLSWHKNDALKVERGQEMRAHENKMSSFKMY